MSDLGSVSIWLEGIPQKDQEAINQLWKRYFHELVQFVRQRLQKGLRTVRDEEDIALSAFQCFCTNAEKGRFPNLHDRDDLWQILVTLTKHKLVDHVRHESTKKRNWKLTQHGLSTSNENPDTPALIQVISEKPSPEFSNEVADNFRYLLDILGDEKYRQVAVLKFEGYSNAEIATQIRRTERLVSKRLETIRRIWQHALNMSDSVDT